MTFSFKLLLSSGFSNVPSIKPKAASLAITSEPAFDVMIKIVFLKEAVLPLESVNRPSSRI